MADATPPKKADLAALPDDVLRTHIFQFSALQKENDHLRAEVARLRRIVTRPYYEGAIGLVAQASAQGYSGVDVSSRAGTRQFSRSVSPTPSRAASTRYA